MRVILFHWNAAEGVDRIARLRAAGYDAVHWADGRQDDPRSLRDDPPDAYVIDLSRLPSHGRELASFLRRTKVTRAVPIVFIEGDPEKTQRVRGLIPDADYTTWPRIKTALARALRNPPAKPVVPGLMDAFAGASLPKKLGIRTGATVLLMHAPDGIAALLDPLPDGVRVVTRSQNPSDVIMLFVQSQAELAKRFPKATDALADKGKLWICWPKKASGIASDLDQNTVRYHGLDRDFVDFKIAAIDNTWSGLCFVRRR